MVPRWDFGGDEGCLTKGATARRYPGHTHNREWMSGGVTTLQSGSYFTCIEERRLIEHECERSCWSTSRRFYRFSRPAVVSAGHGNSSDASDIMHRELRRGRRPIPNLGGGGSGCSHHRGHRRCRQREARRSALRRKRIEISGCNRKARILILGHSLMLPAGSRHLIRVYKRRDQRGEAPVSSL